MGPGSGSLSIFFSTGSGCSRSVFSTCSASRPICTPVNTLPSDLCYGALLGCLVFTPPNETGKFQLALTSKRIVADLTHSPLERLQVALHPKLAIEARAT